MIPNTTEFAFNLLTFSSLDRANSRAVGQPATPVGSFPSDLEVTNTCAGLLLPKGSVFDFSGCSREVNDDVLDVLIQTCHTIRILNLAECSQISGKSLPFSKPETQCLSILLEQARRFISC
jgi:hypothetical protein